jgi:hypothetical protein
MKIKGGQSHLKFGGPTEPRTLKTLAAPGD